MNAGPRPLHHPRNGPFPSSRPQNNKPWTNSRFAAAVP
ncbi:hypothetical protein C8E08_3184 [Paracidovorax citrulli]|nr:hypothetical protein C8E08_3184 [Paracidovorax citrulli]QCX11539.1 hypothetical protein APS58_2729 [Paracidovorax citrulli]REG70021.1 hypothetical protein C8E07_3204 [Paracidovorax citrulli]RLJ94572.1 hypothetical protein C8E06_3198 [Paracidovorax citrulli]SDK36442.1 hypothetical protein SAMN04489709_11553 [Paracidovorax citrulli]